MRNIIFVFGLVLIFFSLFRFFEWRDRQIERGAEKYVACIKAEYNTSPANWYALHGEYPVCSDPKISYE